MKKVKAVLSDESGKLEIIEAYCDICGANCMHPNNTCEGMELRADWGYFSKKDGERWRAFVCERCIDKHFANLIKFEIK